MAKNHPSSPSPSSTGAVLPTPPVSGSQLSLQLKEDLAKLAHNDPDTRRSSLESLKGFIEGELNARSMPSFLEQISGETGKSSSSCAISLFVEVVRVHKQATVPFIPRIMAAVLRTLASSSGGAGHGNNLHQACAKVMAAVVRYAIEPTSSAARVPSSPSAADVLDSLCQPLLGLLSSNVEPVAIGSATCLQAVVEAENWKLAAPELVHDVCCRSAIAVIEKGKHSVAHLHLMRSLATFSAGALHDYIRPMMKVGVHVLHATGGSASACGSWQQRVAAAQLLGILLGCLDQGSLPSELNPTMKALECCRLDKVPKVRQEVAKALSVARCLTSQTGGSEHGATIPSSVRSRTPELRNRATQRKNVRKTDESFGSTLAEDDDVVVGSQELRLASCASSPSSSVTTLSTSSPGSASPSPTGNPVGRIGRVPLYPAKQSPLFPPFPKDGHMAESDFSFTVSRSKSSDFKENTPVGAKAKGLLVAFKSDDIRYIINNSRNKLTKELEEDDDDATACGEKSVCTTEIDHKDLFTEMDAPEADSNRDRDVRSDDCGRNPSEFPKGGAFYPNRCGFIEGPAASCQGSDFATDGYGELETPSGKHGDKATEPVNSNETSRPQMTKNSMSAEDFLIFSTPRRLVRSLQSVSSTPDSKGHPPPEGDQGLDFDCETLSESGWSVRDNPIAGGETEEDDDSPRLAPPASDVGIRDLLTNNIQSPVIKGFLCEDSCKSFPDEDREAISQPNSDNPVNQALDPWSQHSCDSTGDVPNRIMCVNGGLNYHFSLNNLTETGKNYDYSSEEDEYASFSKRSRSGKRVSCGKILQKAHAHAETVLLIALFIVLAFTTLVAILRIKGQRDLHMLVPT